MINNYIFNWLSLDSTDTTASAVLASIQTRLNNPSLIASNLPDYTYKSIKTLLGDSTAGVNAQGIPQWAVNRILTVKSSQKFQDIGIAANFPLIHIKTGAIKNSTLRNAWGCIEAQTSIEVYTNPEVSPSSMSWSIMQRINNLLINYTSPNGKPQPRDIALGVTAVQGISNLTLTLDTQTNADWDYQRCIYKTQAQLII